jgi:hypothetical protein
MAKIARTLQKLFGSTGSTDAFGVFGSDAAGSAATSKDLATIQSLAGFLEGWTQAAASGSQPPRLEDMNSLFLLLFSQIKYGHQVGIPEWIATDNYYANISFVQGSDGNIYQAVTGTDGTPNTNNDPTADTYNDYGVGTNWKMSMPTGYDLDKRIIRNSMRVGFLVSSDVEITPITKSAARSNAHPTYPEYAPYIPRHDADHDVSTTQTSQETVDAFLAQKITAAGVSQFTATLSSGVLTFASVTANNAMLAWGKAQGLVARWHSTGESPTYADSGALFTGARSLSATIAGVHYAISNIDTVANTITLATYPSNGTVTVEIHPYAIAGSTTSFRLRKLSGFVLVPGYDASNENMIGGDQMDRGQGHDHSEGTRWTQAMSNTIFGNGVGDNGASQPGVNFTTSATVNYNTGRTSNPQSDGTNGAPRTGKTTEAKRHGVAMYTFLRDLYATNWTSA